MKFKINEKMIVAVAAVVFFAAFAAIIYFDQPHGEVGAGYGSNEVVFDIEKGTGHISSVDIPDDLLILGMGQEASLSFPVMNTDSDNDVDTVVITIPGATVISSEYQWFEAGEHIWNLDNTTADDVVKYSAELDYAGSAYGGSEYYDVADDDALDAFDNTTGESIAFTVDFTAPTTSGFMTGTSAIQVEASDMIEEATGDKATVEYPYLIAEDNDVFIIFILQPSGFDLTILYGDQTLFGGSRAGDYETSPYGMKYPSGDQQVAIVDKPDEGTVVLPIVTPQTGVFGEFHLKWFEFTVTDVTSSAIDTNVIEEDYTDIIPEGWTGPLNTDLDNDGILNANDDDIDGDGYLNNVDPDPYNSNVGNSPPTGLTATVDLATIKEGETITLSASASDVEDDLIYTWTNDINALTYTGDNWTVSDLEPGTYIFTVSVTDGVNDPVTYEVTVVVEKKAEDDGISPIVIILIVIVVLAIIGAVVFFVMKGKDEDEEEAPTEIAPEGEGTYVEEQYEEPDMFGEAPPMEGPPTIDEPVPSYEETALEPEEAAAELPPAAPIYEEQAAPEAVMDEESQEVQDLEALIDDLESEEDDEDVCPECGTLLEPTDTECPGCGAQFEVALECPNCGGAVAETDEACPSCSVSFV